MLGKLLKYEFKATARTFLPIYIAIVIVSLINGMVLDFNESVLSDTKAIGIMILVALFIALGVITIVVTVQRFNKNLLGDEGYLMFTLPVSPKILILSKTIVSTVWSVLSGIIALVSFGILGTMLIVKSGEKIPNLGEIISAIQTNLSSGQISTAVAWIINIVILGVLSYVTFILTIYLSIAIGQLPKFVKHKKAVGFISFIILNIIQTKIVTWSGIDNMPLESWKSVIMIVDIISIVTVLILFFATSYILEKKLNLE